MDKQEILDEINKITEHLANTKKMLEECNERWKPKAEGMYWYVNSRGQSCCSDFCPIYKTDIVRYQTFNCFQTREQCEAEAEKILVRRQLEDIARRLNKGQKIDWDNADQNKYFICFNLWQDVLILESGWKNKLQGVIYCLDEKFLDVVLKEIGEGRLKKYLRG